MSVYASVSAFIAATALHSCSTVGLYSLLTFMPTRTVIVKLSHVPVGPGGEWIQQETFAFLKAILRWKPEARTHQTQRDRGDSG
jgi:hypothetical protein